MSRRASAAGGILLTLVGVIGILLAEDDVRDTEYDAPDTYETHEPLFASKTIGQTFRAETSRLSAIGLFLAPYTQKQPSGRVILRLRASPLAPDDLRRVTVPALAVRRDAEVRFAFPPLPDSRYQTYTLLLEYPDGAADQAIGVRFQPAENPEGLDYDRGERLIDGAPAGGDLGFTLSHRERPIPAVQAFAALGVLGAALLATALRPAWAGRWTPKNAAIAVIVVGVPILATLPLLRNIRALGLENWNPVDILGVLTPHAAAVRVFGAVVGTKLLMALHIPLGFAGAFLFFRRRGSSALAALTGAGIFLFSSFFALHFAYGHTAIASLVWLPWALLAVARDRPPRRMIAVSAVAGGLLVLEGGFVLSLSAFTFMLLVAALEAVRCRALRPLRAAAVALGLGALLGGMSLLPDLGRAVATLQEERTDAPSPAAPLGFHIVSTLFGQGPGTLRRALIDTLLDPRQAGFVEKFSSQGLPWYEIGSYVGVFPILLAVLGVARRPRALFSLLAPGALFFLPTIVPGLQLVTQRVLLGDAVHVYRLVIFGIFSLAAAATAGVDELRALTRPRGLVSFRHAEAVRTTAAAIFAAIILGDLLFVSAPVYLTSFVVPAASAVGTRVADASRGTTIGMLMSAGGLITAGVLWTRARRFGMLPASR
jgi:hypothetical protein